MLASPAEGAPAQSPLLISAAAAGFPKEAETALRDIEQCFQISTVVKVTAFCSLSLSPPSPGFSAL